MAEPYNINIETKAQLDEIQKFLEELRAINAEISRINGQTFSAVSMSAAELSKTSKDLLAATLANNKAFEYMSGATDKASGDSKRFRDETSKTKNEIDGFSSTLQGAYMELGAMGTRLATQLPSAITATIQAFGRQEMAVQKVASAIRAQGGSVSEVLPIMQSFASEIQRITTYGDEQVLEMQAMASAMGVTSAQMEETIRNAIGLSSALNMDVMTAVKAASAAIQGKTTALQEYIPSLSKCTTESEKLARVQNLAATGWAQAQERVDTLDGKLKQAANAWGDLQEVIGAAFAPAVGNAAIMLGAVYKIITALPLATKALTISLTSLAVGFAFTKVGGLLKVADSFVGLAGGVRTTTAAMHGLNAAIRANPLGLVASAATLAFMALSQLTDYLSGLSEAEEDEAKKRNEAFEARRREAEEMRRATGIIADYEAEQKRASASAAETAEAIRLLGDEIEKLEAAGLGESAEAVKNAERLVAKKRELAGLQKSYLESLKAVSEAEFAFASNREMQRKYEIEKELNAARHAGLDYAVRFREAELEHVEELQQSIDIQKKYYADHAHLVESEEDRVRIMAEAKSYADMRLEQIREETDSEKWLAKETAASKARQQGLEVEIMRARASGNEALAKELEGSQRIAQLASEIFESSRREGMSRKELEALQDTANEQARERYNLEKSISDEAERQNLAKDAQAKIEDIILTNKIEQLKAEGKLDAAKALERERSIKRTMGGLQGVSDEDKANLADTMRKTYAYQDAQQGKSGGSLGIAGGGSELPRKGQRPVATVSGKYADLYNQWKASGSSMSWTAFRDKRDPSPKTLAGQAQNYLGGVETAAAKISGIAPRGVANSASSLMSAEAQRKTTSHKTTNPLPATADTALGLELSKRGTDGGNGGDAKKDTDNIEKMTKALDDCLQSLKDIKANTAAMATKKEEK